MSDAYQDKINEILNSKPKVDEIKSLLVQHLYEGFSLAKVCADANISRKDLFLLIRADDELKKLYSVMVEYSRSWWETKARQIVFNSCEDANKNLTLLRDMMEIFGQVSIQQRTFTLGLATVKTLAEKVKLIEQALDDQEINMKEAAQLITIIKESEEIVTRGDLVEEMQQLVLKLKEKA